MRRLVKALAARLTRKRAKWFLRSTVLSWLIQGILVALLSIIGVGAIAALVSAKVAAWLVWVWQLANAARN